ncbi:MAG: hypothetical protein QM689_12610 [Oscillospiraceae bacterium]
MNIFERMEEKRCANCPAHTGGFNGEDYDDDCIINPNYSEKMCWRTFLPKFIIKKMIQSAWKKEVDSWNEHMKQKYGDDWETHDYGNEAPGGEKG